MDTPTPSGSVSIERALLNIKPEIRKLAGYSAPPQGHVAAKLNQNENPYPLPEHVKFRILEEMKSLEWGRYPLNISPELTEKIAKKLNVASDQVLLGNGSNQLLFEIANCVLSKGDTVLLSPPVFSLNELIVTFAQANIISVMKKDDMNYDEPAFLKAAAKAKLTFICSPDNPTGLNVPLAFLEEVLRAAPGLVLWDEAYAEFTDQTAVPLIEKYPNLLVSRTFSKAYGMAGLRFGYIIAQKEITAELRKANIPYNVNLFTELAARTLLDEEAWMQNHVGLLIEERNRVFEAMKQIPGIHAFPSDANFILFEVDEAKKVLKALQSKGVLIRDMTSYPKLEKGLRVTIGTPEENNLFLAALKEVI